MPLRRLAVLALVAFALLPHSAGAAPSPRDAADLERAEACLDALRTMSAHLVQTNPDGTKATGTLSLARPGRMRLDYDTPSKDFIVADGWTVTYWDGRLRQQSSAPLGSTPADHILREHIRLSGEVRAVRVVRRPPSVLEVTLVEAAKLDKGQMTLVFDGEPMRLRGWRVTDAQGAATRVDLSSIRTDATFPDGIFAFREPERGFRHDH